MYHPLLIFPPVTFRLLLTSLSPVQPTLYQLANYHHTSIHRLNMFARAIDTLAYLRTSIYARTATTRELLTYSIIDISGRYTLTSHDAQFSSMAKL